MTTVSFCQYLLLFSFVDCCVEFTKPCEISLRLEIPLTSTGPHLNSDVGHEKGEY